MREPAEGCLEGRRQKWREKEKRVGGGGGGGKCRIRCDIVNATVN